MNGVLCEVSMDGRFVVHWVSPHQVTEYAIEGNLLETVNAIDLVKP